MNPQQISKFEPFHDLDEQSKIVAAKLMVLNTVKKGVQLFDVGDEDTLEYFLLDGEVELVATDGVTKRILAGDSAAKFPLALLRPRKFSAKVISENAQLMNIEVDVLRQLRGTIPVIGDSFSAFSPVKSESILDSARSGTDAIRKFLIGASNAITENRLTISNFDNVSTTIYKVIQDKDVALDTVTSAVQLDAAISAKLIKSANSAFFGGMPKVDSVRSAVVRLGLDLTIQLVTVMVVKEVFDSKKESLHEAMRALWKSSLKLATYSVVVGRRSSVKLQQGQLLLAGLMCDIGLLVIIAYLDKFPATMNHLSEQILSSAKIKKKLGKNLLLHWKFPSSIIDALENSDDYERDVDNADLCDIVCVARLLIRMTSYRKLPAGEITELPAFKRLGFDANNPNLVQDILEEARTYVQLFTGAFDD